LTDEGTARRTPIRKRLKKDLTTAFIDEGKDAKEK
jgi:hypothetical protein